MKVNLCNFKVSVLLALAALCALTTTMSAQNKAELKEKNRSFCNNYSNGDRISISDPRETTIPATGSLNVDGGQNGGVRVVGSNRSDVLVRACVQAWGRSEEGAKALASSIRVETSGTIRADG